MPFSSTLQKVIKFRFLTRISKNSYEITKIEIHFTSMSAELAREKVDMTKTGVTTNVPDDDYIRLCYYLNCVKDTDCPNDIPAFVSNWESMKPNAYRQTSDLRRILGLAERFSPPKLKKGVFFIIVPKDAFESSNEFFTVSDSVTETSANVALLAALGTGLTMVKNSKKSLKVMFYKEEWEGTYFYGPLKSIRQTIQLRQPPVVKYPRQPIIVRPLLAY
jgi:hypothetical protein